MTWTRDLKVGLFVLAGLIMTGVVIFLIGDERRLFESSVEFHTTFPTVQGLKPGAPVQMGGIDIGHVTDVGYGDDPSDTIIYVSFDVVESESSRIKTDAVAKVAAKGLLGDKLLEITVGDAKESIPIGGEVTGETPTDMLDKVSGMADKADLVLDNVVKVTDVLAEDDLHTDLKGSAHSMNKVLEDVANGEGYPNRFLTDKAEADRISRALEGIELASTELALTLRDTRGIIHRVEAGPGFAHDMIYGPGPQPQIEQFGTAADEVALTLRGIREGDGLARDFLYGGQGDSADAMKNITLMTADLRDIVAHIKAGKGTIGGLLVDPTIYEDLKLVLGNVQRNEVLRALVRYSISQDENRPKVDISKAEK